MNIRKIKGASKSNSGRCRNDRRARCHDERGDKPLKTGPPLNERGLSSEQIARAVSGRLGDKTEEERRAVTLYISSLMKTKDSEELPAPKP